MRTPQNLTGFFLAALLGLAALPAIAADAQSQGQSQGQGQDQGQSQAPASDAALLAALRQGGVTVVMRHAHAPNDLPDSSQAESDNTTRERQLDASGKQSAVALGDALRRLRIPVGAVYTSPTYRARQTARLARFPAPKTREELGEAAQGMSDAASDRGAALRALAAQPPARGRDNFLISHVPNIAAAFGKDGTGLADGEALLVRPDGHGGLSVFGRLPIERWSQLAADSAQATH